MSYNIVAMYERKGMGIGVFIYSSVTGDWSPGASLTAFIHSVENIAAAVVQDECIYLNCMHMNLVGVCRPATRIVRLQLGA